MSLTSAFILRARFVDSRCPVEVVIRPHAVYKLCMAPPSCPSRRLVNIGRRRVPRLNRPHANGTEPSGIHRFVTCSTAVLACTSFEILNGNGTQTERKRNGNGINRGTARNGNGTLTFLSPTVVHGIIK